MSPGQGVAALATKVGFPGSVANRARHAVDVAALVTTTMAGVLTERVVERVNRAGRFLQVDGEDIEEDHPLFRGYTSDNEPEMVQALPHNAAMELYQYMQMAHESYENRNFEKLFPHFVKKSRLIHKVNKSTKFMGNLASTDTQVHVCILHDDTVAFVFRGTELHSFKAALKWTAWTKDVATDMYLLPESVKLYDAGPEPMYDSEVLSKPTIEAHKGFQLALKDVTCTTERNDNLRMVLEDMGMKPRNVKKVVCIGHSLGGAIATLCAKWCSVGAFKHAEITCMTIGSPRVGNHAFAKDFKTHVAKNSYRIVNKGDLIPCLPHHLAKYKHVHGGIYLAKDPSNKESITCTWGGFRSNINLLSIWDHLPNDYKSNFKKVLLQLATQEASVLVHA